MIHINWQNHNYAVDPATLPEGVEVTHINLNDSSCAGLAFPAQKIVSLQYHPEASPGPHDSDNGERLLHCLSKEFWCGNKFNCFAFTIFKKIIFKRRIMCLVGYNHWIQFAFTISCIDLNLDLTNNNHYFDC